MSNEMKDWVQDKAYSVAAMIEAGINTTVMTSKSFEHTGLDGYCEMWDVTSDDFYTFLEAGKKYFLTTWSKSNRE